MAVLRVGNWVVALTVRGLVILVAFRVRNRIRVRVLGMWIGIIFGGSCNMFFDVRILIIVLVYVGSSGMSVVLWVMSVMCLMACMVESWINIGVLCIGNVGFDIMSLVVHLMVLCEASRISVRVLFRCSWSVMIHVIFVISGSFVMLAFFTGVKSRISVSAVESLITVGLSFVLDVSDVSVLVSLVDNCLLATVREHDVIGSRDASFTVTSFLLAVVYAGIRVFHIVIVVVCSMVLMVYIKIK